VHGPVELGLPPRQRDDVRDRDLHHRAGVGERCVERCDAARGRLGQVDLVGADAVRADRHQGRRLLEHLRRDVRLGADAQQVHAVERLDQLGLVERPGAGRHVEAGRLEDRAGLGMEVLEQEGLEHAPMVRLTAPATHNGPALGQP
jgi:hypothetical protein